MKKVWHTNMFHRWHNFTEHFSNTQRQDNIKQKSGVIYWYRCNRLGMQWEVHWGVSQNLWGKVPQHLKAPSLIYDHHSKTACSTSVEEFIVVGREGHTFSRSIESLFIWVNNFTLDGYIEKYNLPYVWDRVLFTIPELKIKNKWEQPEH